MLLGRHNLEQDLVREVREQGTGRDETWMHLWEMHLSGAPEFQLKSHRSVCYHVQSVLLEQWLDALQYHLIISVASNVQVNALLQENC